MLRCVVNLSASLGSKSVSGDKSLDLNCPPAMLLASNGKDAKWHSRPFTTEDRGAELLSRFWFLQSSFSALPCWATDRRPTALHRPQQRRTRLGFYGRRAGNSLRLHSARLARTTSNSEDTATMRGLCDRAFGAQLFRVGISRSHAVARRVRAVIRHDGPSLAPLIERQHSGTEGQCTQSIHKPHHINEMGSRPRFFKPGAIPC